MGVALVELRVEPNKFKQLVHPFRLLMAAHLEMDDKRFADQLSNGHAGIK